MINAKVKLPKLTTRKVWAGMYGGHYDAIVFFKKKPKPSKEDHNLIDGIWYDCLDNKDIIVGCMGLGEFLDLFPDTDISMYLSEHQRTKEIEVTDIFQLSLEWFWDKWGDMASIQCNLDGWQ